MLSTSKTRKPRETRCNRLVRRVSFTETHPTETPETRRYRTQVLAGPEAVGPAPETCPCGVRHDTCIRSETDLGTSAAPVALSARDPFATPMPPRPSFNSVGPEMFPRLPGSVQPPRVDGLDLGSKMYLIRDGEENDQVGSGVPWLQNFGIGVLVATLLAAVLTLALTADRPVGAISSGTSSLPFQDGEKMPGSGSRMAAPMELANVPKKMRHKFNTHSLVRTNVTTAVPPEAIDITHPRFQHHGKSETRRPHKRCGPRFYTYCARSRREAYYSAHSSACAWTPSDGASLCNRGSNRFPSLGSCLANCARDPARELCFESAVFADCSRQDVTQEWWFFDGSGCVQWNFPWGSCPSHGSATFRSREDCTRNCAHRRRHRGEKDTGPDVQQRPHCRAPVAAACRLGQMRFPYFADMTAKGSARCVRASKRTLLSRRCLVGSNRFDSVSACKSLCGARGHDRKTAGADQQ